ncbi:MAG TPA: HAMP domain-containing sensor histidine kinase [Anaerolineales bacterium]|nr:HAMP domain-containing sensor histidine kinase [Anaerolineales bacterium]
MIEKQRSFLDVPSSDPDDARRRRLLNILLVALTVVSLLTSVIALFSPDAASSLAMLGLGLSIANGIIYLINRFYSGPLAAGIFLVMLTLIISFGDEPVEVVQGRTLFFLSFPIIVGSILMKPTASFWVAVLISLVSAALAVAAAVPVNLVAIMGFFTVAFGSWLSAKTLQTALVDLRSINRELDERVEARTYELAEANDRLTELDQLKSKFVSEVSHELRTPVSNLMIYLDILELENQPEQRTTYLSVLREETNRLTQLVNDVLDISHLDLGVYSRSETEQIDLNTVIEKQVASLLVRAGVLGIKLDLKLSDQPVNVRGNNEQITRVVSNLLGNAIKYTEKGSIEVATSVEGDRVVLEINDTGMGIAPNDLDHIFERFYRGENVSQSTIPGTGLGLAIAHEIVESLGGRVQIDSHVGAGTQVTVQFPISAEG